MTSVRGRFNCFFLTTLLLIAIPIGDCGADCYYSCSDSNPPDDAIQYNLGSDGNYHPVGNAGPPATVYGPPVYFRNGYPIPVPQEPPPVYYESYRETRRERNRRELR